MSAADPATNRAALTGWQGGVTVLLAASAWLVWSGESQASREVELMDVPLVLGTWTGKTVDVTQRTVDILETEDVEINEYRQTETDPPVWLARVAGFGTRAAFHPPELCYVGSHFEVLERQSVTLVVNGRKQQVMRLLVAQDNTQFEAWYWFTAGNRVTSNYYLQQAWLMLDSMQRRPMSGTLVRISTTVDSPEQAQARLQSFLESFDAQELGGAGVPVSGAADAAG